MSSEQIAKQTSEGKISDLNAIINNPKDYYTEIYYKKSVEKGRDTIKGAFMSVSKDYKPQVSDSFDPTIYYTNNAIDPTINQIPYDNSNLIRIVIGLFALLFLCFVFYDFGSVFYQLKKDNEIERIKLLKEYEANLCASITENDGPRLNEVCMELQKRIENQKVFVHVALIKFIKSIFSHSFSNLSLINSVLFLVATLFLVKYLTR